MFIALVLVCSTENNVCAPVVNQYLQPDRTSCTLSIGNYIEQLKGSPLEVKDWWCIDIGERA